MNEAKKLLQLTRSAVAFLYEKNSPSGLFFCFNKAEFIQWIQSEINYPFNLTSFNITKFTTIFCIIAIII